MLRNGNTPVPIGKERKDRPKTALITGITGQDGSFLAEFLLSKGYEVHGLVRRASTFNTDRLESVYADPHEKGVALHLHYGDVTDGTGLRRVIEKAQPDEVYNLAAQSHVRVSFDQSEYTADVVATGTLRLLEVFREYAATANKPVRFYQAGSSEMYGWPRRPKTSRRRSIRAALMRSARLPPIGMPPTFAKRMACSSPTASSLTMSLTAAAKPSSPAKLPADWRGSKWGCSVSSS